MFFIGIFGFDAKHKDIKTIDNVLCENCNEFSSAMLIKAYKYFHFFYIPIVKYNQMYFIKCGECQSIHQIKTDKGKMLEKGEDLNITMWDLKLLSKPNAGKDGYVSICCSCKAEIDKDFRYCPHCGNNMMIKK